jgi:hypothetical protein
MSLSNYLINIINEIKKTSLKTTRIIFSNDIRNIEESQHKTYRGRTKEKLLWLCNQVDISICSMCYGPLNRLTNDDEINFDEWYNIIINIINVCKYDILGMVRFDAHPIGYELLNRAIEIEDNDKSYIQNIFDDIKKKFMEEFIKLKPKILHG